MADIISNVIYDNYYDFKKLSGTKIPCILLLGASLRFKINCLETQEMMLLSSVIPTY